MTERARGVACGGDDCQNRAARRYEKCSYLWHYFRRFEPFRPSPLLTPSSLYRRRASRRVLPCPFSHRPRLLSSAPLGSSSPHPLPAVVLISSPSPPPCRAARLCLSDPLLPTTPYSLLCHPYSIAPLGIRSGGAPPLDGRAGKHSGARSPPLPRAPL